MSISNKVTPQKFDAVKIMIKGGASCKEVQKYMGISAPVFYRIKNSAGYAEYRDMVAEMDLKKKQSAEKKKAEKKNQVQKPATEEQPKQPSGMDIMANTYKMTQLIEAVKKQTEVLTLISNKLAYIVEELAGVPVTKKEAI